MTPFERLRHWGRRIVGVPMLWWQVRRIRYTDHRSGTVVFNTLGCHLFDVNMEFYLALLLARAGCQVIVLLDDHMLAHWEYLQRLDRDDDFRRHHSWAVKTRLRVYAWLSAKIFAHQNLRVVKYSTALAACPDEPELTEKDRSHAVSSVLRYFQIGRFKTDDPGHRRYYETSLQNCRMSKRIGLYVDRYLKPDLFVTSHGIYSSWGPCYDLLKGRGYRCLLYGAAVYQPQSLHLVDTIMQTLTEATAWKRFKSRVLTLEQRQKVKDCFAERFALRTIDTKVLYQGVQRGATIEIPRGRGNVLGLFPNVIWDGDIVERNTIFPNAVEWIVDTVRGVYGGPNHLVIRFHPSEARMLTRSRKLVEVLHERLPDLDRLPNVTLIPADARIDIYEFARSTIDVGLVYDTLLSLELTYLGIPVIGAGRGRSSGAGVMFEPASREEYLTLLRNPERVKAEFKVGPFRDNVWPFTYWYLYESSYVVPVLQTVGYCQTDYGATAERLDPVTNPGVQRTVDALLAHIGSAPASRPVSRSA